MSAQLSPIVPEFKTQKQADSHDRWLRRKVQESLDDARPGLTHDEVMAEMEAIISQAEACSGDRR